MGLKWQWRFLSWPDKYHHSPTNGLLYVALKKLPRLLRLDLPKVNQISQRPFTMKTSQFSSKDLSLKHLLVTELYAVKSFQKLYKYKCLHFADIVFSHLIKKIITFAMHIQFCIQNGLFVLILSIITLYISLVVWVLSSWFQGQ